jgi:GntR family transcriptional regulator
MYAMRLWFSRGSAISIRDQLTTQIILGILSGELKPGQRLPSTRELARRFHLHPNTISAGYRQLEQNQWVQFRKGSGVYVRNRQPEVIPCAFALDRLIAKFFQDARQLGSSLSNTRSRLKHWLELQPPDHFLLIEPDPKLADIVAHEMRASTTFPVVACGIYEFMPEKLAGAVAVAISINESAVRAAMPPDSELLLLHLRSAGGSLAPHLPAPSSALIAIASGWPTFVNTARTMLIAAGFDPDCLVLRDSSQANWERGLQQTAAVICDSLTVKRLNGRYRVLVFPLLAESSVTELRNYEQFLNQPLAT